MSASVWQSSSSESTRLALIWSHLNETEPEEVSLGTAAYVTLSYHKGCRERGHRAKQAGKYPALPVVFCSLSG